MCVRFVFQLMMSSTLEQDGREVALETVKSVTLTQDKDGSIILHCPTGGVLTHTHTLHSYSQPVGNWSCLIATDENSQPLQKKLRLSADQPRRPPDLEAPHFSMVTLPSETLLSAPIFVLSSHDADDE